MKTAHLVVGVVLIISSGIIGLFLVSQMRVPCVQAPQSILCTSAGPLILASGIGGLIFFLILGVVVLWAGRVERPQQVAQGSTPRAAVAADQSTRSLGEGGDLTSRRFLFGRSDVIGALGLSVTSLIAWLALRVYLTSLTDALAVEIGRGLAARITEIMRLGGLIRWVALFQDVAFLLAFLLLVAAVGFLAYMWGEVAPDPEKLAHDEGDRVEEDLEAAIEAREREAREKEERP